MSLQTWGVATLAMLWMAGTAQAWFPEWKHGLEFSEPEIVDPGSPSGAPADAIILFDGQDMSGWEGGDTWVVEQGYGIVTTTATTKQGFGDCQLHLEFATPSEIEGEGQGRGNSGVYFMSQYEVQILDSYDNTTYYDGQCGAIYKQHPPLVNASRKPGEWQTYDIIFTAPRFEADGTLQSPAYFTVLHNGVLVQNHAELKGGTYWEQPPKYESHADRLPLLLQYHKNPVRFRNIWIRDLAQETSRTTVAVAPEASEPQEVLLGEGDLLTGIPGDGKLTDKEIQNWLSYPVNHRPLKVTLPKGLAVGASQIKGIRRNPTHPGQDRIGSPALLRYPALGR